MKKTCVIGWPIAHSRSPLIHNYWMKQLGIASLYEKIAIPPDQLAGFIAALPQSDYLGCNVTIPHKEQAFQLAASTDGRSQRLSAANTLYVRDGVVNATSTDGEGFIASLRHVHPAVSLQGARIILLGAGGSARSIIGAMLDEGVASIGIINRTAERVQSLTVSFGPLLSHLGEARQAAALATCDVLINTTSLGMQGQPALEFDVRRLPQHCLVIDIIYTPLQTPLLAAAKSQGMATMNGMGMLLHQAVRGFELWYGVRPPVTAELEALVAADVTGHSIA